MTATRKKGSAPRRAPVPIDSKWPEILEGLADGRSLTDICKAEGMPARQKVVEWTTRDPQRSDAYRCAREIGAAKNFEDMLRVIAETPTDRDAIAKTKLHVDALKWQLSKIDPSKYGDRLSVDHTHGIEGMDGDELRAALSALLGGKAASE